MRILIALCLLACVVKAEDFESQLKPLLVKMTDEDFVIRQEASEALERFPANYINKFLRMARDNKDPEIAYRLQQAAHHIFNNDLFCHDRRVRILQATIDIDYNNTCITADVVSPDTDGGKRYYALLDELKIQHPKDNPRPFINGLRVNNVKSWGVSGQKLSEWDILVHNGVILRTQHDLQEYGPFDPDCGGMNLRVIHFKDTTNIKARGYVQITQDDFELIDVLIMPRIDQKQNLDMVWEIINKEWEKTLEIFNERYTKP